MFYGVSFEHTEALDSGWFFSIDQAMDISVFLDYILQALTWKEKILKAPLSLLTITIKEIF